MEIHEIKLRLPIREVLRRYGLKAEKSGRMQCPFHADENPSFQIFDDTNRWKCFAAGCRAEHGDVIDFIRLKESLSMREAIVQATAWASSRPMESQVSAAGLHGQEVSPPRINTEKDAETAVRQVVLKKALAFFEKSLAHSRQARGYLTNRGLDPDHLNGVGYNSGRFHHGESAEYLQRCEEAGLLKRHGAGHRAFAAGCIIFPLRDEQGKPAGFYGRQIDPKARGHAAGSGRHYYLKNRRGLYPGYPPEETRRLILTEAVIDAASVQMCEISKETSVLAIYGTNGWTREHEAAIRRLENLEHVALCFDGDAAGEEAAGRLAEILVELHPEVPISSAHMPTGRDLNDVLVSDGPEAVLAVLAAKENGDGHRHLFSSTETAPTQGAPPVQAHAPEQAQLDTADEEMLRFRCGDVVVTVRGGISTDSLDRLRVSLRMERNGRTCSDRGDLYSGRRADEIARRAADYLHAGEKQMREVISRLTGALEAYRLRKIEAMGAPKEEARALTESEKQEALRYLRAPDLLRRTNEDVGKSGIVGEETNRLLMYLAFTSRLRRRPLQVLCLAESGEGKTHLQESVGRLIPEEDRLEITALSENALYYFGRRELRHKLLLIEDLDGAEDVLYPIRELQSKGSLTKTVAAKDERTGKIEAKTMTVEGPVAVSAATTREEVTVDNASRALVLHLDGSEEQRRRVLEYQRRRSAGRIDERAQEEIRRRLRNAQRMLRPVEVVNPFAERLRLPAGIFRQKRANELYLALIETITFYHQYQRQVSTRSDGRRFVKATMEDIVAANRLIGSALAAKSDELTGACRQFLEGLKGWMQKQEKESFYAKEIRRTFRLSPSAANRYLYQLRAYGHLEITGGGRYRGGYEYELTPYGWEGAPGPDVAAYLQEVLTGIKST